MKVIIAGSRDITDYDLVKAAVKESGFKIAEIVCGEARGVDSVGRAIAEKNNIPIASFPADWNKYGKQAGLIRNTEMAAYADALVAVTNGSPGTAHMIRTMKDLNKQVFVKAII